MNRNKLIEELQQHGVKYNWNDSDLFMRYKLLACLIKETEYRIECHKQELKKEENDKLYLKSCLFIIIAVVILIIILGK